MGFAKIFQAFAAVLFLCCSLSTQSAVSSGKNADVLIGEKWIDFSTDKGVIFNMRAVSGFNKIILRVAPGKLKMNNLKIYYNNGKVQDVAYTEFLHTGVLTASIFLLHASSGVHKIEFGYLKRYAIKGSMPYGAYGRGKTKLAIWGLF